MLLEDYLEDKFSLSPREIEVLKVVSTGVSNKDAGEALFVCEKTIKFHLSNIYKKMGLNDPKVGQVGVRTGQSRVALILWVGEFQRKNPDSLWS